MTILFEGADNCGKSTQIQKVIHLLHDKSVHQLHYSAVKGFASKEEASSYSCKMYSDMFKILYENYENNHFLLDRSHIGEMVYAPMYRGYSGDYVLNIENYWRAYKDFWNQVYLITFIDSPENLINRDDGLSFTIIKEKKQQEIESFIKATEKSLIINKVIIDVNRKDIETVFEEIRKFINK